MTEARCPFKSGDVVTPKGIMHVLSEKIVGGKHILTVDRVDGKWLSFREERIRSVELPWSLFERANVVASTR